MSTFEIWSRGVPLVDAAIHFAPSWLRRDYAVARAAKVGIPPDVPKIELAEVEPEMRFWQLASTAAHLTSPYMHKLSSVIEVRMRMDKWLLSALAAGKLLAYGYKLPRDPADMPVRLPVDVLESRFVDAGNSTIKGAGLEFASVRIIPASLVETLERQFPPAAVSARRELGRPSVQPLIAEAICELYEEGRLSYGESQKGRLRLIRARTRQKYPDRFPNDRTPSDDTIRSTLKCMEELNSETAPRRM